MATVTITSIVETDDHVEFACSFSVTTPVLSWAETLVFGRYRVRGLTQAQMRDEVLFPLCQEIVLGRIGVNRAQIAGNSILNVAQTIPNTP